MIGALPGLDEPLGSLDFRVLWAPASDARFRAAGRRARVTGHRTGGIDAVWTGGVRILRGLRVAAGTVHGVRETPLGVERRFDVGGRRVVERVVAHRDAPIVWIEWARDPDGTGDAGPISLSLEWRMGLDVPVPVSGGEERPAGEPPEAHRSDRVVKAIRSEPEFAAYVVFSIQPADLGLEPAGDELVVRARVEVPESGFRVALVGAGSEDEPARLLRMADRTRVALRGRAAAANRLLENGLCIRTSDEAFDDVVRRSILRLDEAGVPASAGPWRTEDAVRIASAHLLIGGFDEVRGFLERLSRLGRRGGRRAPVGAPEGTALEESDGRAALLFLLLLGRYLAWSGDLGGARALWPGLPDVARTGPADDGLRAAALQGLAVTAEAIGETDAATEARDRVRALPRTPAWGVFGAGPADPSARATPASTVSDALGELLAPVPFAPRGRLELRPRPRESWDRLEVRGLAVGSAAVDLLYRRDGTRHRFEARQVRGPTPLTLVLTPELRGHGGVVTSVDGSPAELDVESRGGRARVPVQLVLDHPRTLDVEFAADRHH